MQHFLKAAVGAAGAEVVAAELSEQLFVAVDDPRAALHARLGRIAFSPLAAPLKRSGPRCVFAWSYPPVVKWIHDSESNGLPTEENALPTEEHGLPTEENALPSEDHGLPTEENSLRFEANHFVWKNTISVWKSTLSIWKNTISVWKSTLFIWKSARFVRK